METRKVQLTGSSSYIVTLPKEWIISQGIKKNDSVGVIIQPNGMLVITPKTKRMSAYRTKEFNADETEDPTYLFRLLVSAYINGYQTIIIKSKKRISSFVRECAINFTQTAIGPEIVEETINSITIRDLLNPAEMPFDKTINRMYVLAKTMHEDAVTSIKKKDKFMAEVIAARDRDVDRLNWLVSRQFNILLKDAALSEKIGVTQNQANYFFLAGRMIERIGDHAVKIAKNAPVLIDTKVDRNLVEMISSASDMALKIFTATLDAWNTRDIKSANENIESTKNLILFCDKINSSALNINGTPQICISYIVESIRRTGEYSSDISELLINYMVNEETE